MLYRLGGLCAKHRFFVLVAWGIIVASVVASVLVLGMRINNDVRLPGTDAQRASDLLTREFPDQQYGQNPIVFHVARGKLADAANRRAVEKSLTEIAKSPHVTGVISPFSREGQVLVSRDGRTGLAQILFDINGFEIRRDLAERVMAGADPARRAGIRVEAGGDLGAQLSETSLRRSEVLGVAAALIILAFTFGCLVAAGLPVVTAAVGLGVGLGLVGLLGHVVAVPTVAPKLATMIGLGVGIDYALFIVFRHRDQLRAGMGVEESVACTLATAGSAVMFAGATVIVALLALLVARVPMLGTMGYTAALTVTVAVLTAVTLLPAMLALLGQRIDALALWGRRRAAKTAATDNVWARWADFVTHHPWPALAAALLVLVPLAAPTLTLQLGQADIAVTSTSTTLRRAFDLISAGLGPGANDPLVVVARFNPAAKPSSELRSARHEAERLKRRLEAGRRGLVSEAAALKGRRAELEAAAAGLQDQSRWLQEQKGSLQAQAATLQAAEARLLGRKARLTKEKSRLEAESRDLAAQGETAAAEIARVQQELAALLAEAQAVETKSADLKKEAAALASRAARLEAQGRDLAARGGALKTLAAGLEARAAWLTARGGELERRSSDLERQAARLERKQVRLRRGARRARMLKAELTRILTKAAGQPRASDPRVVRLQDVLAGAPGAHSVSPPQVSQSGAAVVFALTPATRPADPRTIELVDRLRDRVIPDEAGTGGEGVTAFVGGGTAAWGDLATLISRRLPLVIATVLALSFLLLLVAFRSLLVPLKAILCNLLAVAASFGVLTIVFQWGWGLDLVGLGNPYGTVPIASYVPLLMFAVLFGMSTDYEVFLISQIFQFHAVGQGPHESVRSGVGTSARVITAAAAIMVTVFASFIINGDPVIKQFGVGMSIAILLDATIVRMVIVPAAMALLGEWNWYLPRWLQWLPRIDLPDETGTMANWPEPPRDRDPVAALRASSR